MTDIDLMASYYRESGFMRWLQENNFQAITADNVGRYYAIFDQLRNCPDRRCYACSGYRPKWETEYDIQTGRIRAEICPAKDEVIKDAAGAAFASRQILPPAFREASMVGTKIIESGKTAVEKYLLEYPDATPPGAYIYSSEHRIGRTTVLWYIVKNLLKRKKLYRDYILVSSGMFAEAIIKDSMTEDHSYFERARLTDVLILDDFGNERQTVGYVDRMITVLEDRYWNKRPVIVSSTRVFDNWAWKDGRDPEIFSKLQSMTTLISLTEADPEIL